LDSLNLHTNDVFLSATNPLGGIQIMNYTRIVKGKEGSFFCNPETDTVFLYNIQDESLTPVFYKIPSVNNLDPMIVLDNVVDVSKYQFFRISTIHWNLNNYPPKYYFRDKETNEIFRQEIILSDHKDKKLNIFAGSHKAVYEDGYIYELSLIELKQANKEKDFFICSMGQKMTCKGTGTRKSESGFVSFGQTKSNKGYNRFRHFGKDKVMTDTQSAYIFLLINKGIRSVAAYCNPLLIRLFC
jgi:hypothetical protein